MPAKQQPDVASACALADKRCQYTTSDGRRCRTARLPDSSLCLLHRQRQPAAPAKSAVEGAGDPDSIGPELLGPFEELKTATAVNHVLGKLFALLARNRIPVRNAAVLAYIGQLLLNSLPGVRRETALAQGLAGWERVVRRALQKQAQGAVSPEPCSTSPPLP